ncbi:hypothetical protein N0V92_000363 [Colletotrichum tropicale]|nr:hypothetical protein N0V92_000363 [Colletotrichum tropicale]
MRNPFKAKKQRQTWEGRSRALTLDDPVFKDWDKEELKFEPRHQKSDEELAKKSAASDSGDPSRLSGEHAGSYYNFDSTLGYATVAGAFSGAETGGPSDAGASTDAPDSGASASGGGDPSGGSSA